MSSGLQNDGQFWTGLFDEQPELALHIQSSGSKRKRLVGLLCGLGDRCTSKGRRKWQLLVHHPKASGTLTSLWPWRSGIWCEASRQRAAGDGAKGLLEQRMLKCPFCKMKVAWVGRWPPAICSSSSPMVAGSPQWRVPGTPRLEVPQPTPSPNQVPTATAPAHHAPCRRGKLDGLVPVPSYLGRSTLSGWHRSTCRGLRPCTSTRRAARSSRLLDRRRMGPS